MSIFQKSVVNKYLKTLDELTISLAYERFGKFYGDKLRLMNIVTLKEENYQEGFLREIFVNVLGYTINPDINFNLTTEYKNQTDSKKADGAILKNGQAIGVIELKSTQTAFIENITNQAFNYKHNQPNCRYVITSNFHYLRFFIDNSTEYEEFDLFEITLEEFKRFYLFLCKDSIFNDIPLKLKEETKFHEENITDKFYNDYKQFRDKIFQNLVKNNPQYDKLTLFKKTQKLLDRFIFIWFAEDCGLVSPNLIANTIQKWKILLQADEYFSLLSRFQKAFHYLNDGYTFQNTIFPAFNGGLFKKDEIIDNPELRIDDDILLDDCLKISAYDFNTELDVNILGHIFEHSLNEIEEIERNLLGFENLTASKSVSKRKKDGIFYTPEYITNYMIENTIGVLCNNKKVETQILDIEINETYFKKGKITKQGKELYTKLQEYQKWLLTLKILDPACGSGAFLNAALEFLINEHRQIDDLISNLTGDKMRIFDTDKSILENNIFGVDINSESVEISKLSLWLRTARKDRTLSDLNNNIKCGNSLIDKQEIVGEKAFDWNIEFPEIMQNGGFDVVIGNPPYGVKFSDQEKNFLSKFDSLVPDYEIYIYFVSLALKKLLNNSGIMNFIIPNTFLSILYGVKYRKNIIDNFFVNYISDLSNDNTFVDASVRTCIISISKQNLNNNNTNIFLINSLTKSFELLKQINVNHLNTNIENWLNISKTSNKSDSLVLKIKNNKPLLHHFEVSQGLIPYDKYRGHDEFTIKNRIWHANFKKDETYKKELAGGDVNRYRIVWNGESWISYGDWLAAPRKKEFFVLPRILIREITNCRLFCSYIEEEFYNTPSIINIIPKQNCELNLKYLLAIINSSLIGWYHNQTSPKAQKGLFPKILINDVRNLPIAFCANQTLLIEKADLMLKYNAELHKKYTDFIAIVKSNFNIKKITDKLKNFFDYDFKEFLLELKKQKIEIDLKKQVEWKNFYLEFKKEINELQYQINQTDTEIDKIVFELYDLTPEEITIIENVKT